MSETNLMAAHYEWCNRPADERFSSLQEMWLATRLMSERSTTLNVTPTGLQVRPVEKTLALYAGDRQLAFNHWSFQQLATRVGAPSSFLSSLTPNTAAAAINERLGDVGDAQLYYHTEQNRLRAITSQTYGRAMNHEVIKKISEFPGKWVTPPARPARPGQPGTRIATEEDCKNSFHKTLGVKVGDLIAPSGLYAGESDMFIFQIDPQTVIDDGSEGGLHRGFFAWNSEVGKKTFGMSTFLFREVCSNHIVWDCSDVKEIRIKHHGSGTYNRICDAMAGVLKAWAERDTQEDVVKIGRAKRFEIAANLDGVIQVLFHNKKLLGKKVVESAYLNAEQNPDAGAPTTCWGFANGLSRISQYTDYADERDEMDRVAGKILEMAQ